MGQHRLVELSEVVRRRRMVREYDPARAVDPAVVDRMLQHAVRAPSAGHTQGWAFLVLDDPGDVDRFWTASTPPEQLADPNRWLTGMRAAPVVVVAFAHPDAYRRRYAEDDKTRTTGPDPEEHWGVPYWHLDTAMAALLVLQTATDEGLGTCWFNVPAARVPALRAAFGVPDAYVPAGAITVGHPAEDERVAGSGRRRPRRPWADVVHRGRW